MDSSQHLLQKISKKVDQQFNIYKEEKLKIDDCDSFDEYYEIRRRCNKNSIIDYKKVFEYIIGDYNYSLILMYLVNDNSIPISYYVFVNVEKKLQDHKSLLSLRYEDLKDANRMLKKYQVIFEKKSNESLLKEVSKDIEFNEWDLY